MKRRVIPKRTAMERERHFPNTDRRSPGGPTLQNVVIVSDRPIFARAIQSLLNSGRTDVKSRIIFGTDLARPCPSGDPDAVLLMPQDWSEFATWLPCLRRQFASRPWLLLADWRLVGMFVSFLA